MAHQTLFHSLEHVWSLGYNMGMGEPTVSGQRVWWVQVWSLKCHTCGMLYPFRQCHGYWRVFEWPDLDVARCWSMIIDHSLSLSNHHNHQWPHLDNAMMPILQYHCLAPCQEEMQMGPHYVYYHLSPFLFCSFCELTYCFITYIGYHAPMPDE